MTKTPRTVAPKHPAPDVGGAARSALGKAAEWLERARDEDLFGARATHVNQAVALQEARALAVNYVRKGAQA